MSRSRVLFFLLSSVLVIPMLMGTLVLAADRGRRPDPAHARAHLKDGKEIKDKEEDSFDTYLKYLAVFSDVVGLIRQTYVDDVNTDVLMAGALEGVTDALDPFSVYVPAAQVAGYAKAQATGMQLSGLGLIREHGATLVMAVQKGSPAEAAGLKFGDLVAKLDGSATRTMPLWEMQEVLAAPPGTKVALEVIRAGQPVQVSFELATFNPPAVRLEQVAEAEKAPAEKMEKPEKTAKTGRPEKPEAKEKQAADAPRAGAPTVTLLRVPIFDARSTKEAREAVAGLSGAHAGKLLIDLRGVSAGDAEDAYQIAKLFASGGLGALKRRQQDVRSFASSEQAAWQGRLVILIDHGTAGPAEVLATVLRQKAGAELVGERTFGHAGRQSWADLSSGGRLFFTDAFYAGPDGKPINESLKPDLQVDRTRTYLEKDVPLGDLILRRGVHRLLEEPEMAKKAA
jgi:carboxyl-terminal processing protease